MIFFKIYGPYKIPREPKDVIRRKQKKPFWEEIAKGEEKLSSACGCYIFAVKAGKGIKPWYIGKTMNSFKDECWFGAKLTIYNEVIGNRKGIPLLIFIVLMTPKGKFAKGSSNKIDFLETILIGAALEKNPKLQNVQKTHFLREMKVPGFINSPKGPPSKSVKAFKEIMFNQNSSMKKGKN